MCSSHLAHVLLVANAKTACTLRVLSGLDITTLNGLLSLDYDFSVLIPKQAFGKTRI